MKLYIFHRGHLNEFMYLADTIHPEYYKGCSTEVPYVECDIVGKSYAFNLETQQWDTLIDDWRNVVIYNKQNSQETDYGRAEPYPEGWTHIAPPNSKKHIWNEELQAWEELVVMINVNVVLKQYEDAIQNYIDSVAQARGYDNGYTCASYADDKNPRFASDAHIFKDWRSDVWVQVNALLNSYKSAFDGEDEIPASAMKGYPTPGDVIGGLPAIEWEDL